MINLLYCGNQGVFDGVMLSLLSAVKKSHSPLHAYVMTMDLTHLNPKFTSFTTEQVGYLDLMVKEFHSQNSVTRIDATDIFVAEMSGCPNMESGYTPYTLLRLVADKVPLPDHILYVDCDTMFNGDISELCRYDITDYELAGVVDHLGKHFIAKDYFNAGVLYLNLSQIRRTDLLGRCRQQCMSIKMPFPDQDAINKLATQKLLLPEKFNQQDGLHSDTIIQHFSKTIRFFPYFKIINVKPWELELVHDVLKISTYDDVYADYIVRRDAISGILAPPRKTYHAPPALKQLKSDIGEVLSYASQNGGIFRKQERT